jgi:hypothetical protein
MCCVDTGGLLWLKVVHHRWAIGWWPCCRQGCRHSETNILLSKSTCSSIYIQWNLDSLFSSGGGGSWTRRMYSETR